MRAVVAAVALVLAAEVSPATAVPAGVLTLQGGTSAWTAFDVPPGVALDGARMTVSSTGRFGGFYVDYGDEHNVGAVWLRDYDPPGETTGHVVGLGVRSGEIPRGRRRIYLVADGPTTVRIPVTGMTSRTLRPARRTTASAAVQDLRREGMIRVSGRQPLSAARRSVSLSSIMLDDTQVFTGTISACLTEPGGVCDSGGADSGRFGYYLNPYGAHRFTFTVSYAPGARAGRFDAVQDAENVAGISYAAGASFTLALV